MDLLFTRRGECQRMGAANEEPERGGGQTLTDREWEVLRLVAAGSINREVAERLTISEDTVKFHVRGILDKLHLHSRREVTARAAEHRRGPRARRRQPGVSS